MYRLFIFMCNTEIAVLHSTEGLKHTDYTSLSGNDASVNQLKQHSVIDFFLQTSIHLSFSLCSADVQNTPY